VVAFKGNKRLWQVPLNARVLPASPNARLHGETFLATETEIVVLDSKTGAETRRLAGSCGVGAAGRADLDEAPEIACAFGDEIRLRDGRTGQTVWTSFGLPGIRSVTLFDADGDGRDDVLVRMGDPSGAQSLLVINGRDGAVLNRSLPLYASGVIAGISGGCEPPAILVTDGASSSVPDHLWLVDGATLAARPVFAADSYGISGFAVGDFTGHGTNEVAIAHDGTVATLSIEPDGNGPAFSAGDGPWTSFRGMAPAQLDADPRVPRFARRFRTRGAGPSRRDGGAYVRRSILADGGRDGVLRRDGSGRSGQRVRRRTARIGRRSRGVSVTPARSAIAIAHRFARDSLL
jgi:hypothetical protein